MGKMTTYRAPQRLCPSCNKTLNAHTAVTGVEGPEEGDATVCFGCLSVLVFDSELQLKAVELVDLPAEMHDTLRKVIAGIREVKGLK